MINFEVKIPRHGDSYKLGEIDFVEDVSNQAVCTNIGIFNIFDSFFFCILLRIYPKEGGRYMPQQPPRQQIIQVSPFATFHCVLHKLMCIFIIEVNC